VKILKKKYLLFLITLLLVSQVYASGFDVEVTPIKNVLLFEEDEASFQVKITNYADYNDRFIFSTLDVDWDVYIDPLSVSADSTNTGKIIIKPAKNKTGDFGVLVGISSAENISNTENQIFKVAILDYSNIIETTLKVPDNINPNKKALFTLKAINNHNIQLDNLKVTLESDFFSESEEFNLMPYETKNFDFILDFEGSIEEGTYPIYTKVSYENEPAFSVQDEMLLGYFPDVSEIKTPETGFLIKSKEIIKKNEGNVISHETHIEQVSIIEKIFTTTNPKPDSIIKEDGEYILTWSFDLQPNEVKSIYIETSYRTFTLVLIILIILIWILISLFKKDISIQKKVITIKQGKEGSSIKMQLILKNHSNSTFKNVRILDSVINVVERPSEFGTLHPDKIMKGAKGYKLLWNIQELKPKEERIFSYKAKSKIYVIGKLIIPRAVLRYKKKNLTRVIKSNKINLFS